MENHQFKVNIIYRCPFSLAILNYNTDLHGTNLRPNLLQKSSQHLLYLWEGKGWMKLSCCHNNGRPRHEKKQNRNIKKTCGYNLDIQWWDETFCRISCCSSTYVFMEIHRVWWFLNGFTMVYGSTRCDPAKRLGGCRSEFLVDVPEYMKIYQNGSNLFPCWLVQTNIPMIS